MVCAEALLHVPGPFPTPPPGGFKPFRVRQGKLGWNPGRQRLHCGYSLTESDCPTRHPTLGAAFAGNRRRGDPKVKSCGEASSGRPGFQLLAERFLSVTYRKVTMSKLRGVARCSLRSELLPHGRGSEAERIDPLRQMSLRCAKLRVASFCT